MSDIPPILLIVDADAASRRYLGQLFQANQYKVLATGSGKEGLVLAWQERPSLILIDPALPDMAGLEMLRRLRQDGRTADTPCIILTGLINQQEMSALLSAGANEYQVKSNDTVKKLLELIPGMLTKTEPGKTSGGALVVFLSAKGGVGTSSLCANIAMNTGTIFPQAHIALMDLVLPIGSIASIVGYTDRLNLLTLAAQKTEVITPAYLQENLPRVPAWSVQVLAGAPDPASAMELQAANLPHIVHTMKAAFDAVFIDTGRSLSRISIPIILDADVIVLVTSPEHSSISMTRTVIDYLKNQGVDPQHFHLILNRNVSAQGISKPEIEKLLGMDVKVTIPFLEGNMALANDRHEPYTLKYTNDSTSMLLQQTTRQIVEQAHHLRGG